MKTGDFLREIPCEFFAGVPDSQLKALCDALYVRYGVGRQHCIAHNEGGALALASGYYLATGKVPCVYMQNSGLGNVINPIASLTSPDVYAIPTLFVVGWRGEPGVHDEPQHVSQGKVTLRLLEDMGIATFVLDKQTDVSALREAMKSFEPLLAEGRSAAIVVRKGALEAEEKARYANDFSLTREEAIATIVANRPDDLFVSTTGKASRELFEIREARGEGHRQDFLTVGSMGHCSMIALGIAGQRPGKRVWCIDGDGAVLMHMGTLALIGHQQPENYVHVLLNNGAHETVGGMPTVSETVDYGKIALACGYRHAFLARSAQELEAVLGQAEGLQGPIWIEVKVSIASRDDLGRPTTTPIQNRDSFMAFMTGDEKQ